MKPQKIKAVIFDMDGVLIDAKDWHYEALNRALDYFGYTPISRNDHLLTFDGLSTKKKLTMHFQTKDLTVEEHEQIDQKKQELTFDIVEQKCVAYPPHVEMLEKLKSQGYLLAVCSNSIRKTVEMMLSKASIIQYFDFYLSNQDVKNSKPDPEMYNTAISRMNLNPSEALICEDNVRGIESALKSNAFVLEVGTIVDVNYKNVSDAIVKIESGNAAQMVRNPVRTAKLADMIGGWFVGDFYPNILRNKDFEVGVKFYKAGDKEDWHVHKVGTEITVILDGTVKMRDEIYRSGDIILLEPGNGTAFEALTDVKTVVVKTPSVMGDKYKS
ncbi:MAG: HAD-IA family hydrolase [Pseudomonadota bacterium]